jgi:hypothetical protein
MADYAFGSNPPYELSDVQAQAGPNRKARKAFLMGAWRKEE